MLVAQFKVADLLAQADRLRLTLLAGPTEAEAVTGVEVIELASLPKSPRGTLAIIAGDIPAPYLVDVALRRANALGVAGIVFPEGFGLTVTAAALADNGAVAVMVSGEESPTDLAVAIDRVLVGGAAESMTRASYAMERAIAAAGEEDADPEHILAAASGALGATLTMSNAPHADWTDSSAVFIGEVSIARLSADHPDDATRTVIPVVSSLISRSIQRQIRDRFGPNRSRADLIAELTLAEASRVDVFVAPAARLGLPLQLSHAAAWIRSQHRSDPDAPPPRGVQPAIELFALQLVEDRAEQWHITHIQDGALIVCTEEHGAGDHQRRLREIAERVQAYAGTLSGDDWTWTLGLGTPQSGPAGLRQSAAEARVAADSAITAGRLGGVETTDVTGLRRVLLDFYASPISRSLLEDALHPLDALGPQRSLAAVRTLLSYLSNRNSLSRAGRELMLHPNAVGYRMRSIRERLDVDLDDPDVRFAVELACRVRLLGTS